MATIEAGLSTRKAGFADRTERGMGERLRGADPDVSTLGEGKLVRPNIGYLNCRCCLWEYRFSKYSKSVI